MLHSLLTLYRMSLLVDQQYICMQGHLMQFFINGLRGWLTESDVGIENGIVVNFLNSFTLGLIT